MKTIRMAALGFVALVGGISKANDAAERAAVAAKIGPVLANPPATGLLIFGVLPNSQSAKAGFQVGDILTVYDAQPVASTMGLMQLARKAAAEGRKKLPVIVQRGQQMIDAEFDLAELGLRLVPVKEGDKRVLWRPETPYRPDWSALQRAVAAGHRYEILTLGDKCVGWSHAYFTKTGRAPNEQYFLRIQSRLTTQMVDQQENTSSPIDKKSDVVVGFVLKPTLPVTSVWIQSDGKVVLDAQTTADGRMTGTRVGVRTAAAAATDVVSSYLAGWVATSLPLQKSACLRCSYLDPLSLVAAPYADIFCLGVEQMENRTGKKMQAHHFEQTVFGETVAEYWLDSRRDLVQTMLPNGMRSTVTTRDEIAKRFRDFEQSFDRIENLPQSNRGPALAN